MTTDEIGQGRTDTLVPVCIATLCKRGRENMCVQLKSHSLPPVSPRWTAAGVVKPTWSLIGLLTDEFRRETPGGHNTEHLSADGANMPTSATRPLQLGTAIEFLIGLHAEFLFTIDVAEISKMGQ